MNVNHSYLLLKVSLISHTCLWMPQLDSNSWSSDCCPYTSPIWTTMWRWMFWSLCGTDTNVWLRQNHRSSCSELHWGPSSFRTLRWLCRGWMLTQNLRGAGCVCRPEGWLARVRWSHNVRSALKTSLAGEQQVGLCEGSAQGCDNLSLYSWEL